MPDVARNTGHAARSRLVGILSLCFAVFASQSALSADRLRDPMRPYEPRQVVAVAAQQFTVSAIFSSRERRVAIVNGRRVVEGDTVDGATIVEIFKDSLRLEVRGETINRRLAGTSPKRRN